MDWDWIWKSVLLVVGGTILLRIAGRKSIAQMTLAQTVIMVGIGSLLIQPVAGFNISLTFSSLDGWSIFYVYLINHFSWTSDID